MLTMGAGSSARRSPRPGPHRRDPRPLAVQPIGQPVGQGAIAGDELDARRSRSLGAERGRQPRHGHLGTPGHTLLAEHRGERDRVRAPARPDFPPRPAPGACRARGGRPGRRARLPGRRAARDRPQKLEAPPPPGDNLLQGLDEVTDQQVLQLGPADEPPLDEDRADRPGRARARLRRHRAGQTGGETRPASTSRSVSRGASVSQALRSSPSWKPSRAPRAGVSITSVPVRLPDG